MNQKFLDNFPRIYYFFPCIKQELIEMSSGHKVKFDEPMDAFLWMLEIKGADSRESACWRTELLNLVFHWYGEVKTLERAYDRLRSTNLIQTIDGAALGKKPGNYKFVWLTPEGLAVLERLKQKRYNQWLELWKALKGEITDSEKESLNEFIKKFADFAFHQILLSGEGNKFQLSKKNQTNNKENS